MGIIRNWLGVPDQSTSWRDRVVATVISMIGMVVVVLVSQTSKSLSFHDPLWLVGSIGASAVLVFGVPHGALSQPWSVIGGHLTSAVVGITVAHVLGRGPVPAAIAVGAAVGAMHLLRCIHPPGGATALAAVMMVTRTHTPSWQYPLTPVLLNAVTIVVVAVALNAPFGWRRYPLALAFPRTHPTTQSMPPPFTHEQFKVALREIDVVATMSEEDLDAIYRSIRRQQDTEVQR